MIEALHIRDFALVDDLSLDLTPGFTVLTGETGAGKSLLLQALGLLLGDRASRESVRAGAEQARVEGLFFPSAAYRPSLCGLLDEAGVAWAEEEPLIVARTVSADGRSRAHVNGASVPAALLERLGAHLVEISSQHQHQGLLREETHLGLLDLGLEAAGRAALAAYADAFAAYRAAASGLERLETLDREGRSREDLLRYQAEEIRSAAPEAGEDERLRAERDLLLHAGKLLEAYAAAEQELYSGADSALDRLGRAARGVEGAARRDPDAAPVLALLAEARAGLEEAALRLRERQKTLEADPGRIEVLEERLEVLRRLDRKYGPGIAQVLARLEKVEAELWELENRDLALERARRGLAEAAAALETRSGALRERRAEAAAALAARVGSELEQLGMGKAAFRVELVPGEPGPRGDQTARFLLAANPGEPPRALAKTASGGELSRILLALKNALRDAAVESLVFDEVDAGIGGAVADSVGERLAALAESCQVLCITHLPQIACRAARHLRVEKHAVEGRTVTRVRPLGPEERVEELARMLGGRRVTDLSRSHARELMERRAR